MKRSSVLLCLMLALLLLLSACGETLDVTVYRLVSPDKRTSGELVEEERVEVSLGLEPVDALITAFNMTAGSGLLNPLPNGARIKDTEQRGGTLRLITEGCENMDPFSLSLLHCCAALTFCTLDGIGTVSLYASDGETELCPPLSRTSILLEDIYS